MVVHLSSARPRKYDFSKIGSGIHTVNSKKFDTMLGQLKSFLPTEHWIHFTANNDQFKGEFLEFSLPMASTYIELGGGGTAPKRQRVPTPETLTK